MLESPTSQKTEVDWKKELSPEEYEILRQGGTEAPFTGNYWDMHEQGMYTCRACGVELFSSETKFDSGTGWPSFSDPTNLEQVELVEDLSHGLRRTEVRCKRCGSHLGHVFPDGPGKSGQRYCVNSTCLRFEPK
ncbi:MAG TPA: peptide-methionine (R)-S-oxide reductase MsrB [Patescibacteria group bacterium]|nr:peptide-methionine (R)-S-oxide reductase MsrB [Patescibacteria group bacterium]